MGHEHRLVRVGRRPALWSLNREDSVPMRQRFNMAKAKDQGAVVKPRGLLNANEPAPLMPGDA